MRIRRGEQGTGSVKISLVQSSPRLARPRVSGVAAGRRNPAGLAVWPVLLSVLQVGDVHCTVYIVAYTTFSTTDALFTLYNVRCSVYSVQM